MIQCHTPAVLRQTQTHVSVNALPLASIRRNTHQPTRASRTDNLHSIAIDIMTMRGLYFIEHIPAHVQPVCQVI